MSRIDVVPAEKGKFKVMVNFVQYGSQVSSVILADHIAETVKKIYPQAALNLLKV